MTKDQGKFYFIIFYDAEVGGQEKTPECVNDNKKFISFFCMTQPDFHFYSEK
jgi:hypothetical protein